MLGENQIPFLLIFTKSDKQSQTKITKNVQTFLETIAMTWESLPPYFITSALTGKGKDDFLDFIEQTIKETQK